MLKSVSSVNNANSVNSVNSANSALGGGGKICFWAENHVSEIDLTKILSFFNEYQWKYELSYSFYRLWGWF